LFRALLLRLQDPDVVDEAKVLEVAELIVACEEMRAELAGKPLKPDQVNALTRLQSTTARAERALLSGAPSAAEAAELKEHREIMAKYLRPAAPNHESTDE
jgi:hypothetical protein